MRRRREESDFSSKAFARHRCEIWRRFSAPDWWICVVFLAAFSGVGALQVNIPQDIYEFARGDNITLPCIFETMINPALVVITWTYEGLQADSKENLIATYYSHTGQTDVAPAYENRFSLDVDLVKRKANLNISSISLAENKVFECRVLIPGDDVGKLADTARLVVQVAPSKPICKIQGKAEYGQNINLTCVSEGSPPPTYSWTSHDVRDTERPLPPQTTTTGGLLSLFNLTRETSGFYICTSTNKIRSASCNVTLSVMPPSMNIISTAGIIGGVVFLLILLIIIIVCCCRYKKKKDEGDGRKADGQEGIGEYDDVSPTEGRDRYEE